MFKNTASQKLDIWAVDASTGLFKSGDSANIVLYVQKDDGAVTAITSNSGVPTEVDATNAKGQYSIALSQAETNADKLVFTGKSSTSNIVVVAQRLYTIPASWTIPIVTTVTNQLTAAQIATGVWQDTTAGDFTVASSIGKSLYTSGAVPGAANGLLIAGTNAATSFASGSHFIGTVDTLTTYTGNTVQTGDAYARIGAAGAGLTAVVLAASQTFSNTGTWTGNIVGTLSTLTTYTGNTVQTGDSFARIGAAGVNLSAIPDEAGVTTLLARLTALRAGYLDNLSAGAVMLASSYTAPLTAAGTRSAVGLAAANLDTQLAALDADILTRLATSGYTAPPTAASIATAIFTDTTASDFTTASSPGKILVTQLGGTFTTTSSSVFSTAALANAPGAGSAPSAGTVAAAVWDLASSGHTTSGTFGQLLAAAGAASDPLLNQVPGNYGTGSGGAALGRIGTLPLTVTVVSPVSASGNVQVIQGDDYFAADGRALSWTDSGQVWPDLTSATAQLQIYTALIPTTKTATVTTPSGTSKAVQAALTTTDTAGLAAGSYPYRLVATLANGHFATLVRGTFNVHPAE